MMVAASYNSNPEIISALIDAGADVNMQSKNGHTALTYAAGSANPVRSLLQRLSKPARMSMRRINLVTLRLCAQREALPPIPM